MDVHRLLLRLLLLLRPPLQVLHLLQRAASKEEGQP